MENTRYGRQREGRWNTSIRAKAQDTRVTRANTNSWETHLVRKRRDIGLLRALSLWIMMTMMMMIVLYMYSSIYIAPLNSHRQTEALLVRLAPRKETSFKK